MSCLLPDWGMPHSQISKLLRFSLLPSQPDTTSCWKNWCLNFVWAKTSTFHSRSSQYSEMSPDFNYSHEFKCAFSGLKWGERLNLSKSWCSCLKIFMIVSLNGKMMCKQNLFISSFMHYDASLLLFYPKNC